MVKEQAWANRLYCKSSEDMSDIPDDAVSLTITSPPYWNAIDYDRHAIDPTQNYRTRAYADGFQGYDQWLGLMVRIFDMVRQKTRPGGYLAVVIGTVLLDGELYPAPMDLVTVLTRSGWRFHQDIVWHKCTAGVKRAGLYIQHPWPGYFRPNIMTEFIMVFRKDGEPIYKHRTEEERAPATGTINRLFTTEVANNIWHIAPVPPGQIVHPCPFPEEIPARLIDLYSYPGDVVLDPFLGSGQTTKVAKYKGRRYVGYDIIQTYIDYAESRLTEPSKVRSEQLIAVFEKIPIDAERTGLGRVGKTRHGAGRRGGPKAGSADTQTRLL